MPAYDPALNVRSVGVLDPLGLDAVVARKKLAEKIPTGQANHIPALEAD
jgi:hypothetical protein